MVSGPPPGSRTLAATSPWYKQRAFQAVALLLVLALGAGGYLLASGRLGKNEVLLEAKAAPGPDPFTPPLGPPPPDNAQVALDSPTATSVAGGGGGGGGSGGGTATRPPGTGGPPATVRPTAVATSAPGAAVNPPRNTQTPAPAPTAAAQTALPAVSAGGPVALAGGPAVSSACDSDKLVVELDNRPTAATAWGDVLKVKATDLKSYASSLRSGYLRSDTRFTNYGFRNGKAQPRQAVLESGTPVLLDPTGVPVVRCLSGTPLLPPVAVSGTPSYTGARWPGFNPTGVVASSTVPQSVTVASAGGVGPVPSASGRAVSANLITDGGFENGLVAPWGTGAFEPKPEIFWGAAQGTATVVTAGAHGGKNALLITNNTAFAPNVYRTMSQQVKVSAGQPYCLSYWVQGIGAAAGILSMPLDKAWAHRVAVPPGVIAWTQFSGSAIAEGSTFDVRLISENKGSILVDDIEFTAGACTFTGKVPAGTNPRAPHA